MKPLRVRRVSRAKHLSRYVGRYILRRLGKRARERDLPRLAVIAHDEIGDSVVLEGRYDPDILEVVTRWLLPRASRGHATEIAMDVGANIGNHALALAPFFAKVLAFEPNSVALHLLRANVEMNEVKNVEIIPCALGRANDRLWYDAAQGNIGAGRLVMEAQSPRFAPVFQVRNGDEFVKSRNDGRRIGFIKVDVEGMEAAVLEGLAEVLRAHRPVVLFEALTPEAYRETQKVLRSSGYDHFFAIERQNSRLPLAPLRAMLRLVRGSDVFVRRLEYDTDEASSAIVALVHADWVV
jgi:FkbM family methyltransferase